MSETKHTPLPWDLELDRSTFGHLHIKRAGEPGAKAWITYFYDWRSGEEVAMADAQLIVTSVNARPNVEELVKMVEEYGIGGNTRLLSPMIEKAREIQGIFKGEQT